MSEVENIGGIRFRRSPYLRPDNEYSRRKKDAKHIVVHCAATPPSWDGGAEEIREWHVHERGWMDIGYHYVIRRDGTVENGRPLWAIGAGVFGFNASSVHICLVGGRKANTKLAEDNFTEEQRVVLGRLIAMLQEYALPKAQVCGHRDFPGVLKSCPSFDVKEWWRILGPGFKAMARANQAFANAARLLD